MTRWRSVVCGPQTMAESRPRRRWASLLADRRLCVCHRLGVICCHHRPNLLAFGQHFATTYQPSTCIGSPGKVNQMTTCILSRPLVFSAKICPTCSDLYASIYSKYLCGVLVIISNFTYYNQYVKFVCGLMAISHRPQSSMSAANVLVIRCCPHHLPPSSINMSISTSPHFTRYIHRFPPQNLFAIYRCNICTSAFYHCRPCGRSISQTAWITCWNARFVYCVSTSFR